MASPSIAPWAGGPCSSLRPGSWRAQKERNMIPVSNAPISIVENQQFTGTSSASTPVNIANWLTGSDWTLALTVSACFAGAALISIEDSTDGFVDDIQIAATLSVTGPIHADTLVSHSWRARELPSFRVGVLNASARISVTSPSRGASVTLSIAEVK
jgi:hypothetical protein